MTAIPQTLVAAPAPKPVSRRLVDPLRMVAGRARVLAFFLACLQVLVLAGAGWLVVVLVLGTMRDLPVYAAVTLALAAWGILFAGAVRCFGKGRVFHRENLSSAARRVDAALPATQERISSAVELSQETDARFKGSPELVACLIRQAEKDADKLDPNAVVSGKSVLRWGALLVPLLVLWLILLVVKTPNILLGLQRTLQPWVAAPAQPTAILHVEPGNITVPQGEEVNIQLTVESAPGIPETPDASLQRATITRRFTSGSADQDLTSEMDRTGPNAFRSIIPNAEQSFSYNVASEGAQSPTYTVSVQSRPAVANVEIAYEYPRYTRLAARTDKSRDGAIDALVGTKVKITVEATQPLKSARLEIADNAPNPATLEMSPVASNSTRYTTELTLAKSTQYKIRLLNPQNLENKDNQPRPIVARLDAPPQINIISPIGTLKVRPDDAVALLYTAADDFSITKIEALVQVDELPQTVIALPLPRAGMESRTPEKWSLSVADVLRGIARSADAKRITYQLRATDNCEPIPQTGLSARQMLEIDKNVAPLAQRQDSEAVKDLMDAIKKAAAELKDAKEKLEEVKKADATKPLGEKEKQQATDARQRISDARKDLTEAADKAADTRLTQAARQARAIAEDPLRQAEEKAADTQLAGDQPEMRQQNANEAQKHIDEAQRKLGALAQNLGEKAREQPLAQELERLAAEQRRLADAMEKNPQDAKLQEQQRALQSRLEKVIKQNPELQKPAADAQQARQDELVKNIQQLEQAQQPLADSLKNQAEPGSQASKDAAVLQEEAKKLGEHIAQATKDHDPPTRPSDPANQQASRLADELKKESQQLGQSPASKQAAQDAAKSADAARREAAKGDAAAAQRHLAEGAAKLAEAAKSAQANKSPAQAAEEKSHNAESSQQQQALADKIEQAAKDAQALQQQTQGAAPDMSQRAGKAAQALQQAAEAQRAAAKATQKGDAAQGSSSQEQSADKLATAEESLTGQPSAARQRPNQQIASGPKPPQDQTPPNSGNSSSPQSPPQNAGEQPQPQNQSNKPEGPDGGQQPTASNQPKDSGQGQQKDPNQSTSANGGQKGEGPGKAQGSSAAGQGTGSEAGQTAGTGNGQGEGTRQGAGSGQAKGTGESAKSGQSPGTGQTPESKSGSGTGQTAGNSGGSGEGQAGNGQGQGKAGSQSASSRQPSGTGSGNSGSGSSSGAGSGSGGKSGQAGTRSLAQSIQSARNAQSQAAGGDPRAARQAADQLSQASEQLTGSSGQSPDAAQSAGASPSGTGNSAGSGSGKTASGGPGGQQKGGGGSGDATGNTAGTGSGQGIKLTEGSHAPPPEPPKAVQDIGLSPSDWARLPANMQEQLLHSAQQSGPPSYHEMIKNYYSRIARLQIEEGTK